MSGIWKRGSVVVFLLIFPLLSVPIRADDVAYFTFQDRSQVTIEGSSTVRDWTCRGPDVRGYLRVGASMEDLRDALETVRDLMKNRRVAEWRQIASRVALRTSGPPRVRAAVPVRSMDCGNKAMNEDMYGALKADRQPALLYELYEVRDITVRSGTSPADGMEYKLRTTGAMAIAGMAKTIELTLVAHRVESDTYHLQGKKQLNMSDFNITPPTAFFGLIKAYDAITLQFDLTLNLRHGNVPPEVHVADRDLMKMDYGDWLK